MEHSVMTPAMQVMWEAARKLVEEAAQKLLTAIRSGNYTQTRVAEEALAQAMTVWTAVLAASRTCK